MIDGQTSQDLLAAGRRRVVITGVKPELEEGRFAIKRTPSEKVLIEADIFADGHDALSAVLKFRRAGDPHWTETPLEHQVNDLWQGAFVVPEVGEYRYTVEAWVDPLKSWQRDLEKKSKAGMDVAVELEIGARGLEDAAGRASGPEAKQLLAWAGQLRAPPPSPQPPRVELALDPRVTAMIARYPDRRFATHYSKELRVIVDPPLARFGAWYEVFPRSLAAESGRHGTFRDCEAHLGRIAGMGFDVLYLPPIHPIGRSFRKGPNNRPSSRDDDVGSPWAIGSAEGGHKAIHSQLGTLDDFRHLVNKAGEFGLRIALDIAFQCSPDHPYVKEHPEWFRRRPDGSIQYAENPPKQYQDIYPFDFETEAWFELWQELKSIFEFWIEQGVSIFRVDNPHTKPFAFWEWLIAELKHARPDLIFLAEAFTRPKLMYRLAKLGFTQSYNYFPWRNTRHELTEYFTELTGSEVREYFRPSLWPNTPDILTQYLQYGGRPAFMIRLLLAATLAASYGIYGPAFELCQNQAYAIGSEEYLDSEKYEIKRWNLDSPESIAGLVSTVNRIRRENPALQINDRLRFHGMDNEQLIAYSKTTENFDNVILVLVNLDPHHTQSGWTTLRLDELGLREEETFQAHDLLTGERYLWTSPRNYIELNPARRPAHVFRLRRRVRSEQDFDNFR